MEITAELSMYPLDANYKPPVIDFIMVGLDIAATPRLEIAAGERAG